MRRTIIALIVAGVLGAGPPAVRAEEQQGYLAQFGWGMAAIGANLGYMPAKFLYAVGGGLVALLAYGVTVGNSDAVQGILSPSIGGTWVLTPQMLRHPETILFVGESYEPERASYGASSEAP